MKIKSTFETHVFVSEAGYLAIKQIPEFGETSLVQLSPEQARLVVAALNEELKETSWWTEQSEETQ